MLVPDRELSDYFEEAAKLSGKPQAVGNWIANDLLRELAAARIALAACKVPPGARRRPGEARRGGHHLQQHCQGGLRRDVSDRRNAGGDGRAQGTPAVHRPGELEQWCAEAIAANPKSVADFKGGKENAINAMKGFVMKQSKGRANPKLVDEILRRKLAAM